MARVGAFVQVEEHHRDYELKSRLEMDIVGAVHKRSLKTQLLFQMAIFIVEIDHSTCSNIQRNISSYYEGKFCCNSVGYTFTTSSKWCSVKFVARIMVSGFSW